MRRCTEQFESEKSSFKKVTTISELSDDLQSFVVQFDSEGTDDGMQITRNTRSTVLIDAEPPPQNLFELSEYQIDFRTPTPKSPKRSFIWIPIAIAIFLFALAAFFKIRHQRTTLET